MGYLDPGVGEYEPIAHVTEPHPRHELHELRHPDHAQEQGLDGESPGLEDAGEYGRGSDADAPVALTDDQLRQFRGRPR